MLLFDSFMFILQIYIIAGLHEGRGRRPRSAEAEDDGALAGGADLGAQKVIPTPDCIYIYI